MQVIWNNSIINSPRPESPNRWQSSRRRRNSEIVTLPVLVPKFEPILWDYPRGDLTLGDFFPRGQNDFSHKKDDQGNKILDNPLFDESDSDLSNNNNVSRPEDLDDSYLKQSPKSDYDKSTGKEPLRSQDEVSELSKDDCLPRESIFKKRFNKGLKMLSVIVRDIVIDKKTTTYKEVANIILKQTMQLEQLNTNTNFEYTKEEQNIKRRVYDALNVLISAGILTKEGKIVKKNDNSKKVKININNKRTEINTLKSKIVC